VSDVSIPEKWQNQTSKILHDTYQSLLEGLTGIAASDRKQYFLAMGHFLQRRNRFRANATTRSG
jgi:hypothetical protein